MIYIRKKLTGKIAEKANIKGKLNTKIIKLYPELEDLEVIPSGIEQDFKSEKYGYDNVKVRAVESETLEIKPKVEEQQIIGLFGIVNVNAVDNSIDTNIKPENIRSEINILGIEGNIIELNGEEKTIIPTVEKQIIIPSENKNAITKVIVEAMVVPSEQWYTKEVETWT